MKKKNKIKFDESVHYSIKGRKRYKRKLWLVFLLMVVILAGCSAMFYFSNYSWNPDEGFTPTVDPKEPYQIALTVLASVISAGALVGTFLYCWFDIGKFYKTQELYFKSPKFRENKAKALKVNMLKLDKKTLKWYKKLGYINAQERRDILEKQKSKKKPEEKTTKN
ncbi:MAG: hypothetical protein KBS35_02440 [Mycoplasma sp.]|nr:hypothetical protein [Candidatus Hennigella equi]